MSSHADGVLERSGHAWRLRFTRHLAHPPSKVWRAVTEAEHRDAWFPQRIIGEFRIGAPLKFASDFGDFDGEVTAFEPPRLVEFRWGTDLIRLELAPEGDGTLFTLADTFSEQGKAARDAAGWHVCLDALQSNLDGLASSETSQRWKQVHPEYVERFGPEAATIGPPAGAVN